MSGKPPNEEDLRDDQNRQDRKLLYEEQGEQQHCGNTSPQEGSSKAKGEGKQPQHSTSIDKRVADGGSAGSTTNEHNNEGKI